MKNILFLITILAISSLWSINESLGQTNKKKIVIEKSKSTLDEIIESISICKWKYDTQTCMNFSFDDNNISHKKIAELFDQFNFKATFFVIASYMNYETMNELHKNGHEIGNHTYSHLNLASPTLDSTEIEFQVRHSRLMIENAIGAKCLSFTEPYHSYSLESKRIVFYNHLFDRDYSQNFARDFYEMNPQSVLDDEKIFIENKIRDKKIILFTGHGVDGDGSEPISTDFLRQTLELTNEHVLNGDLWVTTIKEGIQYDNIFQEIQLEKSFFGDTIMLRFKNFNRSKYKDSDKAPISVSIPKTLDYETTCLTNLAETRDFANKIVFTTDLMRDTTLIVLNKPIGIATEVNQQKFETKFNVFPNPGTDYINLNIKYNVASIEIYNLNGQLQLKQTVNDSKIDISKLDRSCYIIKIKYQEGSSAKTSFARFIKI